MTKRYADQMSFPETVSDSFAEILWLCRPIAAAAVRVAALRWSWRIRMLAVEVLGCCDYTWSAVVRPVGCSGKLSETPLVTAYGREVNIQFTGNSSGGHSCSQHANCTLPQNLRHLWLCCVIKLHISEWPFIVTSVHTYQNNHFFLRLSLVSFLLRPDGSTENDSSFSFSSYSRPIGGAWNSPKMEKKRRSMCSKLACCKHRQ